MKKRAALLIILISVCFSACSGGEAPAATTSELKSSNPVVLNADGDIDMTVALAYKTDVDTLLTTLNAKTVNASDTVSDNSSEKTMKVFDYLRENWGKNVLVGQEMTASTQREDILYYALTEDLPAIKGFDMIDTTGNSANNDETGKAIAWHTQSNGLVSFCWHWRVPRDINDTEGGYAFYSDEIENFSLKNAVTEGTKEYEVIIHDIDTVAVQLQKLEAAGVPILWRPLHEASGSWFWWGKTDEASVEYYRKLWYILYDRLENYHKLTNLIWIWNGQDESLTVNANTYDISGIDIYPKFETHSSQSRKYDELSEWTADGKMLALTEVGYIPDIDDILDKKCMWLYFMPWYGDFVFVETGSETPSVNTERMTEEFFVSVMKHKNSITWSELPDWGGTQRNLPEHIGVWQFYTKN